MTRVGNLILASLMWSSTAYSAQGHVLEEVVVSASRSDQTIGEIPASISVVDEQDLADVSHTHLNEALQRVAGVWISRGNGQESLTAIRSPVLTGAGGCGAFLMSQNNIPLQAAGFCNVNELFGAHSEIARRVEIIRGPGTALHGSNAMHGLINVITPAVGESLVRGQIEGGPHDYQRLKLQYGRPQWRLDVSATHDAGFKLESGFDQQKATLSSRHNLGDLAVTTILAGTNLNQETSGFVVGDDAWRDSDRQRENPNPEAYRDVHTLRGSIRVQGTLANGMNMTITPHFRSIDMDFLQHFLPGQPIEQNGHHSAGVQASFEGDRWIVGADAEWTMGELREYQPGPTTGSAFLAATIPQGLHYDYEVTAVTAATFVQYRFPLGTKSRIEAGARFEVLDYDYDNQTLAGRTRDTGFPCGFGGCRFNRPSDRSDRFVNLSPKLGLIYDATPTRQFYARLAQGFRAPQATELYRLQGSQNVSQIDAESLLSVEAGIRGMATHWSWEAALYRMRKTNVIFRDSNRMNVDNAKTRHAGLEVTVSWYPNEAFSANLFINLANHEYANDPDLASTPILGNKIDTAPSTIGSANLQWKVADRWQSELEWVHMGSYFTDPQNTNSYPGHGLLNVRVRYRPAEALTLFARVMNLADRKYAERADLGFGSERYFIGEPRSVYLGILYSLRQL